MLEALRPFRIFVSGNCQMQFVADSLRQLFREQPDIAVSFSAAYRPVRDGDAEFARRCDIHVVQVTNLAADPWSALVPASARRIRVPALALPGVFHVLAPRVHPDHVQRGRPPYYLARGNRVLDSFAARFRRGEAAPALAAEYLRFRGTEIDTAPRLLDMNIAAMRRLGRQADFDPWRDIEPRLGRQRFFWSVKHPTLATGMILLRGVLDRLDVPWDAATLDAIAHGPEYHEPYHAPLHPRVAERLDLAWAGDETRYRFYQSYFTAADHARRYIAGDFRPEFVMNKAIADARTRADAAATAELFRASRARFPEHGQADLWYGRVLQRLGKRALAAFYFGRAFDRARRAPHLVPHRADIPTEKIEAWLKRAAKPTAVRRPEPSDLKSRLARLEGEEARLHAEIRALAARRRLAALYAEKAAP